MIDGSLPRRPRIVITVGFAGRQPDPALAARKNELYAAAIRRHGGDPRLIDTASTRDERFAAFAAMDGLVLSGGADVHPARYGEPIRGTHAPEEDRDGLEAEAWVAAFDARLPVLGICRGLQAINVFLGGRLVQHVDGHAGAAYGHGPALRHPLTVVAGTRLAWLLDPARGSVAGVPASDGRAPGAIDGLLEVNSYHHQAVRLEDLAPALVPAAWAPSSVGDLVEAIELPGAAFVIGVQCHPERTESTPPVFEALWRAFVDAAASAEQPSAKR